MVGSRASLRAVRSVQHLTTGNGTVRFNPNLYQDGKVRVPAQFSLGAHPAISPGLYISAIYLGCISQLYIAAIYARDIRRNRPATTVRWVLAGMSLAAGDLVGARVGQGRVDAAADARLDPGCVAPAHSRRPPTVAPRVGGGARRKVRVRRHVVMLARCGGAWCCWAAPSCAAHWAAHYAALQGSSVCVRVCA